MFGKVRISGWGMRAFLLLVLVVALAMPGEIAVAQEGLKVEIFRIARLGEGGQTVDLLVVVRCTLVGYDVLETLVYVVQDGFTSQFASFPVTCGPTESIQFNLVRVSALDMPFHRGAATASAYVLLIDPENQDTVSAGDFENIRIRRLNQVFDREK